MNAFRNIINASMHVGAVSWYVWVSLGLTLIKEKGSYRAISSVLTIISLGYSIFCFQDKIIIPAEKHLYSVLLTKLLTSSELVVLNFSVS